MSRVEDREAERIEQRLQEQKLMEKRLESKRSAESQTFSKYVAGLQQSRAQDGKAQDERKGATHQQGQQSAREALMARQGITANRVAQDMQAHGDAALLRNRRQVEGKEAERGERRAMLERLQDGQEKKTVTHNPVTAKHGSDGSTQERDKDKKAAGSRDPAKDGAFQGMTGGAFTPVAGIAASQYGSSSAGAPAALSAKEVIDELVARVVEHVYQGVDAKGFGLIQVQLRDNVLAGSTLTLHSTAAGVSLKVATGDPDVERLLSAGATAKELSTVLEGRQIRLTGLEVNDLKVI
ncbi:MAG TPA: hypothetical protein VFH51_20930 [Myxococcota bacterium]|nr:hypothetical protein [Myxococcota bacterium]